MLIDPVEVLCRQEQIGRKLRGGEKQRQCSIRSRLGEAFERDIECRCCFSYVDSDVWREGVTCRRGHDQLIARATDFGDAHSDSADDSAERGLPTGREIFAPDHGRELLARHRAVGNGERDDRETRTASAEGMTLQFTTARGHCDCTQDAHPHTRESSYGSASTEGLDTQEKFSQALVAVHSRGGSDHIDHRTAFENNEAGYRSVLCHRICGITETRHGRERATATAGRLCCHLCLGLGWRGSLGWLDVDDQAVLRRGQVDAEEAVDRRGLLRIRGSGNAHDR